MQTPLTAFFKSACWAVSLWAGAWVLACLSFCHNRNSNYELIWAINMEILHNYIKFDIMNLANLGGYYGIHCLGYHLQLYTE